MPGGTMMWMSKRPSALQQRMDEKLQQTQPRSVLEKMDEKLQRMDRPKQPVMERMEQKLQRWDPPEEKKEEVQEEAKEEAKVEEFRHKEEVATRVVSDEELRARIHEDANKARDESIDHAIFLEAQRQRQYKVEEEVPTKEVSAEELRERWMDWMEEVRSREEMEETKNASADEAKEERIEGTKDSAVKDGNLGLPPCPCSPVAKNASADETKEEIDDEASVEVVESGGCGVSLLACCRGGGTDGEDASLARWAIDHVTDYQWDGRRRNEPDERLAKWAVRHLADDGGGRAGRGRGSPREEARGPGGTTPPPPRAMPTVREEFASPSEQLKQGYRGALSRAAVLNAAVEAKRKELELKKIELERMQVEEKMERSMGGRAEEKTMDGTVDSILNREIDLGNLDPSDVPDGITHYEGTHFDTEDGAGGFLGAFKGMFRK